MKKITPTSFYSEGLRILAAKGFDVAALLHPLQKILVAGGTPDEAHRDHDLRAPLVGYRGAHVCEFDGETIVLVYRDTGRRIIWEAIGEHDAAYQAVQDKP